VIPLAFAVAALVGCTSPEVQPTAVSSPTGRLCDQLPTGSQPGNPAALVREPADVALQWIPVLTKFEAAIRASGLAADLRTAKSVTILAPTDDAFERKISQRTYDELVLSRKDELRTLLRAHLLDRSLSVAELRAAGQVTPEVVCGDYRVANGTIHVVDGVLGAVPSAAASDDPAH
jgi:uncharacterized surface protein with fasciclin (FAS1) repeats